jgi:Rap1a immunity proteins
MVGGRMNSRCLLLGTVLLVAGATAAPAAVTESEFPPKTVRDLIAICAPDHSDPMMTAAVNFCHGYAEGAVDVEEAHEAQKGAPKLFCLPTPPPPRGSELTSFIAWANAQPARLDIPAIDGMFIYLAGKYPCPAEAPTRRSAR